VINSDTMIRVGLRKLVAQINVQRAERGEPDLTYKELAAAAALSPTTIAQFSTGKAKGAEFVTLDRLLSALEVEAGRPIELGELLERVRPSDVPA
jgi:DNA-binding Xre family transcriptional regulator